MSRFLICHRLIPFAPLVLKRNDSHVARVAMAVEIERKFLVIGDEYRVWPGSLYEQGYLSIDPDRTVRVRIAGDRGFLTVKGKTSGTTRAEFEYETPLEDARQMLLLCEWPLIQKKRFRVPLAGYVWEIDEFQGPNQGLVLAEIELQTEADVFKTPDWIGREVTHDPRFYNSNLVRRPFQSWPPDDLLACE
ncbi:MAG: CYTH domain-containing protein [Mariniblastus sp.]|nr:CYTH domain-containing protein [Mariniblastus sp.]